MFAGTLNKGFRGALPFLSGLILTSAVFSIFSFKNIENSLFPNLFYNYFAQTIQSNVGVTLFNYLLIVIGMILINQICVNQEIVEKQNFFPVFLYLFLSISAVQPFQLSAQACTNIFIILSLYKLLDSYRKENVTNLIFEAAFYISLSAFISFNSIINFPLFFIALFILRPFSWREWIMALIGFAAPVFIYECIAYLSNFNQWYFIKAAAAFFDHVKVPSFSEYYLPLIFFLILLLIISAFSIFMGNAGNTVKKQKAKSILLWYALLNVVGLFSGGANSSQIILVFSIPLSYLIGDLLFGIRQTKFTNTILTLLMLCLMIIFLAEYDLI